MVNLLDNFLNLPKLFLAVASNFTITMTKNGGCKERKINSRPAMGIQMRDGRNGAETKVIANREHYKKNMKLYTIILHHVLD
jgi:hypothetical protein